MSDLQPSQWATTVLQKLGVRPNRGNVQAMVGWAKAEGGHWNNDAKYNPLNTTQPMPGAGNTGTQGNIKSYRSWDDGVQATVDTLKNGRYGGILQALKAGDPSRVASAIGASPWGTSGTLVAKTIGGARGTKVAQLAAAGGTSQTPMQQQPTSQGFDQAGYDDAMRRAVLGRLIANTPGQNPTTNPLLATGLLGQTPNPMMYQTSSATPTIANSVMRTTPTPTPTAAGQFRIEPSGMRPGTKLAGVLQDFVSNVAGHAGQTLDLTTGTNHSRFTVDGRVSDHADGHAGDFAVPVDSHQGDTLAAHALVAAGIPWHQAWGMARKGGLYSLVPSKGKFAGHRIQVIWRTNQGGNHHNHVHIGIR